jgi:FKBP-type peptidyl-prolyl cis-trans isomerase
MALDAFSDTIRKEQQAEHAAQAEKNEQEGGEYRKQNAAKAGVTVTASGLQYEVLEPGDGPKPTAEDRVRIHYRGTLVDGTEFDSSYERGEPAEFGVGGVVKGFGEALQLMSVGSKYRIVLPPELAYGSQGSGGTIGPKATLIFELELLEIVE